MLREQRKDTYAWPDPSEDLRGWAPEGVEQSAGQGSASHVSKLLPEVKSYIMKLNAAQRTKTERLQPAYGVKLKYVKLNLDKAI